jgi:hypothetical protein
VRIRSVIIESGICYSKEGGERIWCSTIVILTSVSTHSANLANGKFMRRMTCHTSHFFGWNV